MRNATLSELGNKEVISCCNCARIGYICDVCINLDTAQVISVIVMRNGGLLSAFKKKTVTITWDCIQRIGEDLIIAEYDFPHEPPKTKHSFISGLLGK